MKTHQILFPLLLAAGSALAFPAAPDYSCYGTVRDESGRPLDTGDGIVIVSGSAGEITRSPIDTNRGAGINYTVHMPMDSNTTSQLFQPTALRPTMPFTMRVVIGTTSYVPIQMSGKTWTAGKPGARVRIDLTLGVDSDGDGLPDSWEQGLMDNDTTGLLTDLSSIRPGDDLDKDGLTNLQEYQLGTYALDRLDGLTLNVKELKDGKACLEFTTVAGRTYRVKSSPNLKDWADEPIAVTSTAAPQGYLRATDTTPQEVFVPVNDRATLYFRLYAE
jgi:hypothetical protein